jgi:hypothetical protein
MNLDGENLYTKFVDLNEIYKFSVYFFIFVPNYSKQCSIKSLNIRSEHYVEYLGTKMTPNEKRLNWKM